MKKAPAQRIVYGLHELFVLFPYTRGAKQTCIVLRAAALCRVFSELRAESNGDWCRQAPLDSPVVLGELLNFVPLMDRAPQRISRSFGISNGFLYATGAALDSLKQVGPMRWGLRCYRLNLNGPECFTLSAGSSSSYSCYTKPFNVKVLRETTYQYARRNRGDDKAGDRRT